MEKQVLMHLPIEKPVLRKLRWWWDFGLISDLFLQYPPFSNFTEKAFEFLLRYL